VSGVNKEALRQQMLLRALMGDARPGVVAGWMRDGARFERGLSAYRANAGALAERALAAAFPTLRQLVGADSFAALARDFWRRHPPLAGDIGLWGDALPAFVADAESLADEPCLADVARLEWALHLAERAADGTAVRGLERLATHDPAALWLRLAPGTALVESVHPIATLWHAHRRADEDRFAPVREAFAAGVGEAAFVARDGHRASVEALPAPQARFVAALLGDRSLGQALAAAGAAFAFEPWLIAALQRQLLAEVSPRPSKGMPA
jgi:hypothetical protein